MEQHPPIRPVAQGIEIRIHTQPGASKTEVAGRHGDAIKIRVKAPPVEGKANEAIIEFLSEIFGKPKSSVHLLKGQTSRQKIVLVAGVTMDQIPAELSQHL